MPDPILVAGATGYVGGRLAPLLLQQGYTVRALARNEQKVRSRPWGAHANLEVATGDIFDQESLKAALHGCSTVYYLIHCMEEGHRDFSEADRRAACNLVRALKGSTVKRIIYLSGLLPDDPDLSAHLRSRGEVAEILSLSDVPLTTLQAAQLIGAGSASFEMIRYLVDRLPLMLTPKWTHVRTQPISITDALGYLTGVLTKPQTTGQTYDIGGPDIVSYAELFHMYADAAGLHRRILIPVPWLTLGLSARWITLVTPIPSALARPLLHGMRNEAVCSENRIRQIIPIELTPIRVAIERALGHVRKHTVQSCWFDAGLPAVPEWVMRGDPGYAGSAICTDAFAVSLAASPEEVWRPIVQIGGRTGWYSNNILWKLRGIMDKWVGGPGIARGRRSEHELYVGDGLDFWRVLDIQEHQRLLLFTEMRLPGEGMLNLRLIPGAIDGSGQVSTDLIMSLYFRPRGIPGRLYWHAVTPFHKLVFPGMLRAIARRIDKPVLDGPRRITAPPPSQ